MKLSIWMMAFADVKIFITSIVFLGFFIIGGPLLVLVQFSFEEIAFTMLSEQPHRKIHHRLLA